MHHSPQPAAHPHNDCANVRTVPPRTGRISEAELDGLLAERRANRIPRLPVRPTPPVVPTQPSAWARLTRWLRLRQLRARYAQIDSAALELQHLMALDKDQARANRLAYLKCPWLDHRIEQDEAYYQTLLGDLDRVARELRAMGVQL